MSIMRNLSIATLFLFLAEQVLADLSVKKYLDANALFERECISEDASEAFFSKCQQLIEEKISAQQSERDQKIIALAAQRVMLYHAFHVGDIELIEKIKSEVESELREDVYANLLTRIYFDILYQEGRYIEAYALLERSALIENNEVTHQDVAGILGLIDIETLHDHQISHLKKAVMLSTTEQSKLLFKNQLYSAIKKHKGQDSADHYKQEVKVKIDYSNMAQRYSVLVLQNEFNRKKSPPFCQPYSFDLISTAPCQVMISGFENALLDKNTSDKDQQRFKNYLKNAYHAMKGASLASDEEIKRLRELYEDN